MIKVPINEKEFITFENIDLFLQEYNPNNKYLCVVQAKEDCYIEEISSCLNYIKNYFILNNIDIAVVGSTPDVELKLYELKKE
jgi:hypothetical protein